jgi:hypothetical protein
MTRKRAFLALLAIFTLALGGAGMFVHRWLSSTDLAPPPPTASLTPEAPATIMISCEKGGTFGLTIYPRYAEYCRDTGCTPIGRNDLAPEPAMLARCRPDEDLNYDVQSTKAEIMDSTRRPEIAFLLTETGQVRDAVISRSSGSRSLDLKVLSMVANRHYKPTRCGSCQIFVAPPVNLKKSGLFGSKLTAQSQRIRTPQKQNPERKFNSGP